MTRSQAEINDEAAAARHEERERTRKAVSEGAIAVKINKALHIARLRHGHPRDGSSGSQKLGVLATLDVDSRLHRFQCVECGEIVEVTDMEAAL